MINSTSAVITLSESEDHPATGGFCEWIIDVQRGQAILDFESFNVGLTGICSYFDQVQV